MPTRYDFFFELRKKGVWRSCSAVGLRSRRQIHATPVSHRGSAQRTTTRRGNSEGGRGRRRVGGEGETHRFAGSLSRQPSTISLNAREYLCTPPSRSRVGGAPCTLQQTTPPVRIVRLSGAAAFTRQVGRRAAQRPRPKRARRKRHTRPRPRPTVQTRACTEARDDNDDECAATEKRETHVRRRTVRDDSRECGARPCASSRAVMPNDQMSALAS